MEVKSDQNCVRGPRFDASSELPICWLQAFFFMVDVRLVSSRIPFLREVQVFVSKNQPRQHVFERKNK